MLVALYPSQWKSFASTADYSLHDLGVKGSAYPWAGRSEIPTAYYPGGGEGREGREGKETEEGGKGRGKGGKEKGHMESPPSQSPHPLLNTKQKDLVRAWSKKMVSRHTTLRLWCLNSGWRYNFLWLTLPFVTLTGSQFPYLKNGDEKSL